MTENEIIIAHLKAQIIIEQERIKAMGNFVSQSTNKLVCERLIENLGMKIIAIS
jgi:hypothetical protein